MELELMILMSLLVVTLGLVFVLWISGRSVRKNGPLSELALHKEQGLSEGYIGVPVDLAKYVGKRGRALTVLRPAGKVKVDGVMLDAVSIQEFINAGEEIVVAKYENTQLYVNRVEE